jgi:hypothetical protein
LPTGVPQNTLFHVARNSGERGTVSLVEAAEDAVRTALPAGWRVEVRQDSGSGVDALFEISAPDGTVATVLIEAKTNLEPRDVSRVAAQIERYAGAHINSAMVVTPFASPMARDGLARLDLGWFDLSGNLRLRVDRPSIFIDRVGAHRNPAAEPADRRLKSLRGPSAAKVVLYLADCELPMGVRALASAVGVSVSTSARVLDLLDREAVISRDDQGQVSRVRKAALVRRWTEDYGLTRSNEVIAAVDPRGLDHALESLRDCTQSYTTTGSVAQRGYLPSGVVPVSPLMSLTVYADNPVVFMRATGLRKTERGSNVLVVKPFDEVVHSKAQTIDGIRRAAPAQVIADLLTAPGRSTEEAEQLIEILAADDPAWVS